MAETATIPTVEEMQARLPEGVDRYEIVDGEVILRMADRDAHNKTLVNLLLPIGPWARPRGAEIRIATFGLHTSRTRYREPDLMVIREDHLDRIGELGMVGPPDLAVEILSPSTRRTDMGPKVDEYAAVGVGTYWIIDPEGRRAWVRDPADAEPRLLGPDDLLTSAHLEGIAIRLAEILP
jgi:Uma2 family endonuclease